MPRYFIELSYDGTNYNGWQIQENSTGVQDLINQVFSTILRENIHVIGCGRTDTGVHAINYFAHFDFSKEFDIEQIVFKANCMLPKDIAILAIHKVVKDAHARFSALSRTYHYFIHFQKDPFKINKSYFRSVIFDVNKMQEAANLLLKYEDFTSFSKTHTQVKNNLCKIHEVVFCEKENELMFKIKANRFLRGMVRSIMGSLIEVGTGVIGVADFEKIIQAKDRKKAGMSVPPGGLFLVKIEYPESIFIQ